MQVLWKSLKCNCQRVPLVNQSEISMHNKPLRHSHILVCSMGTEPRKFIFLFRELAPPLQPVNRIYKTSFQTKSFILFANATHLDCLEPGYVLRVTRLLHAFQLFSEVFLNCGLYNTNKNIFIKFFLVNIAKLLTSCYLVTC